MERASIVVGAVLMAVLLTTAPVAATAPLASQDRPSSGTGSVAPGIESLDSRSVGDSLSAMNDVSVGNDDTATSDSTVRDGSRVTPMRYRYYHSYARPANRPVWRYDENNDAKISYSEARESYEDYLDDYITWEAYLNVANAYFDDETVVYPDPDNDGMTIREERVWRANGVHLYSYRTDPNPDGDQFSGFTDPRPATEDMPPSISVSFPDGIWDGYTEITFSDESGIDSWEIISRGGGREVVWPGNLRGETGSAMEVIQGTDNITARAVDNNGNEREIFIDITENDEVNLVKSTVDTAGLAPVGTGWSGGTITGTSTAGSLFAGAVAGVGAAITQLFKGRSTGGTIKSVPTTTSQTHTKFYWDFLAPSVKSAVEAETLTLPVGYSESVSDPAGGTLHRGYGHEFLSTTSVDLVGVYRLLTTDRFVENVYQNGEKTVVIGDNGLGKTIAVTIIGGVVQAASDNTIPTQEVTDGTQNCREVKYDDRHGEGIRDHVINNNDKPIDSIDLLELVISEPSSVGSGDDLLYYIRQMSNGNYAVVKVWKRSGIISRFDDFFLKIVPDAVEYWATTTLTNTDNKWFDTIEDAKDAAEDGDEFDWNDDPSGC